MSARHALDLARRRVLVSPAVAVPDLATQLAREHHAALLGFALKLSGDPSEAADLVQDTFERAMRRLDRFEPGSNQRGWLCTILHNLFIDRWRRSAVRPGHDSLDEHVHQLPLVEPEPPPAWMEVTTNQVWAAVARLEDDLRAVYELHVADGLSYQEVAARLGIAVNTVGTRLLRARKKLRELLSQEVR